MRFQEQNKSCPTTEMSLILHTSLKYRNICAIFEWIIHIDEVAEILGSITKLAHWKIL